MGFDSPRGGQFFAWLGRVDAGKHSRLAALVSGGEHHQRRGRAQLAVQEFLLPLDVFADFCSQLLLKDVQFVQLLFIG